MDLYQDIMQLSILSLYRSWSLSLRIRLFRVFNTRKKRMNHITIWGSSFLGLWNVISSPRVTDDGIRTNTLKLLMGEINTPKNQSNNGDSNLNEEILGERWNLGRDWEGQWVSHRWHHGILIPELHAEMLSYLKKPISNTISFRKRSKIPPATELLTNEGSYVRHP